MLESYQIERLNLMKEILSHIGDSFILKGGTALKFYYGLDRYSEDLDFDTTSNGVNIKKALEKHKDFKKWIIHDKKDTEFSTRFTIDYGATNEFGAYPLKIDISARDKAKIKSGLLKYSKINGVNVYNIETIAQMKRQAFLSRNKIRDFYDIGFLLDKYPQCFDMQNLMDIENKIQYMGADELNLLLINEVETHKLNIENDDEIVCNYAEKILDKINKLQNESQISNTHTITKSKQISSISKKSKSKSNENGEINL